MVECELILNTQLWYCVRVLIDTWWNVNSTGMMELMLNHKSFNRYMVECEFWLNECPEMGGYGFNRYMVECESFNSVTAVCAVTCFNRYMVECEFVLIALIPAALNRFNRYMVECELFAKKQMSRWLCCFNRYMVECESIFWFTECWIDRVLIDTWWNVNESHTRF